ESNDTDGNFWLLSLDRERPIQRIELVNRRGTQSRRMGGLQLEILDKHSVTVAKAQVTDPGSEGVWHYSAPTGTQGRFVRISLPENQKNDAGDQIISLAEVMLFTSENLALNAEAYMMRFNEGLPPTANGNDGKYNTHTETTNRAVGSYWETDFGEEKALYQVRVIAADGFQRRLTHTTVRVYDGDHNSVFSQHLDGREAIFDVTLPGPVAARYVRIGYENKERSDPPGVSWYLGLKELQAFGLPLNEAGLHEFGSTLNNITQGSSTRLAWSERDLRELRLYPQSQSLGPLTQSTGKGEIEYSWFMKKNI
ncbi:discoidin domain-containing protein, partial [Verrucomicrobia bacterium]|nr:discoidin domain-containing protein [Verrucomicrobiota bacterium]